MPDIPAIALTSTLAFALGSLPFAYLVARAFKGVDIRTVGSRNPGALNVYRSVGPGPGLLVFLLDAAKGLLSLYIARWLGAPEVTMYLAAVLVAVGHNWSPLLGFAGGKGVATVFGVSLALFPWMTLLALAVTLLALALTRMVIPSFAAGFILLNVLTIASYQPAGQIALCLALTLLVAGTHFGRAAPEALALVRHGRWRDLVRIE